MKMNDGSCNHMACPVCGAEFCWLCMKEISDLHYLRFVYNYFFVYT
jgi:E3 ubiquitin-protein ligase RNF19A